jgi:hypothetical protein
VAILLYLLPSAFVASFAATPGFVFIVSVLVIAYAIASILAALSLLVIFVPPSRSVPLSLVSLPLLVALALPAVAVTVLGAWGSAYWYLVYLLFLPSGLLIAAHVALLADFAWWRPGAASPLLLAFAALVGSTGSPVVAAEIVPIGGWQASYFLAVGMLILAFGFDIGLALWIGGIRRRERPQAPRGR